MAEEPNELKDSKDPKDPKDAGDPKDPKAEAQPEQPQPKGKVKKEKKPKPAKTGKKKSKLPMVVVLLLVLGGGGFFTMKKMGHKKEPPKAPKVGSTLELDEFLVNLAHGSSFLKCKIALGLAEGTQAKALEEKTPAMKDDIVMILSGTNESDLRDTQGKLELKKRLKDTLNALLTEKTVPTEADNASQEHSNQKATPGDAQAPTGGDKQGGAATNGPVLEVYFTAFAMS